MNSRAHTYIEHHIKRILQIPRGIFEKNEKNSNLLLKFQLEAKKPNFQFIHGPILFQMHHLIIISSRSVVEHYFCTRRVPGSNPPVAQFLFPSYFMGSQVQIQAKKSNLQHLSTPMPHPSGGLYGHPEQPQGGGEQRKAAEIGLKCKINSKNALLLHRKNEKFHFFKNPSFKFKNLLGGVCPHIQLYKKCLRTLPNFFLYLKPLNIQCV